ncbi:MAG: SWIM zinc finger family protein [Armatimonadota bacterium]|nr:SWIM zinc finger family protein [Armatimonadota bacterium]
MSVKSIVSDEARQKAIEERRKRAEEALRSGQYRVERVEKGRWQVINGDGATYTVAVEATEDGKRKATCTCPDFRQRGLGTCKHVEMVRLFVKNGQPATAAPTSPRAAPAKPASPAASASAKPTQPASAAQPAKAATEAQAQPNVTQTALDSQVSTQEDPGELLIGWGKYKGMRLREVPRGFVAWAAFKMEVRSEEDRRLQAAARALLDRQKAERPKAAKSKAGSDPVATFIAAAALEIYRELAQAQTKGLSLDDPVARRGIEMRFTAVQFIADKIRELVG